MKEPTRRSDALKVLSDFSLNEVYPFLFELAKKGTQDPNPYVRKIAYFSLLKISNLTEFSVEENKEEIHTILENGLKDFNLMVFSAALIVG